jgi:hypothetical protein
LYLPGDGSAPYERRDRAARQRRDALAAWHQVPAVTFAGMSLQSMEDMLHSIRDTPSRWAGIVNATAQTE